MKTMADKKKKKDKAPEEASKVKKKQAEEAEAAEETAEEKAEEPGKDAEKKEPEEEPWADKYARLMADFQNFRKRTEKEKSDVYAFANEKIMTDLLQVVDNFERALESECKDDAYRDGMKMIFEQMLGILQDAGLEEIEAQGEDFDPNFHHAVMQDKNDDYDSGKVTEVLQKGYTLNGKVIRPSMVKVNE